MKEIKFRTWDKKYQMLEYDVSPDLLIGTDGKVYQKEERNYAGTSFIEYEVVSHYEVMQYTGLKDKNGKEIYEGDVVPIKVWHSFGWKQGGKEKTYNAVVSYSPEEWSYVFEFINYDGHIQKTPFNKAVKDSYVVIGNIYENPGLLGESK